MSQITTHVLDTVTGRPAKGVAITLEVTSGSKWKELARSVTNDDGRVGNLLDKDVILKDGVYRITFALEAYFKSHGRPCFYPEVSVVFNVLASDEHTHIPLLLSGFGYSTYRGS